MQVPPPAGQTVRSEPNLTGNEKTQESPAMAATSVPTMKKITAADITAPPAWAVLQRRLIGLMEQAAPVISRKYADHAGTWYWSDDMDDY